MTEYHLPRIAAADLLPTDRHLIDVRRQSARVEAGQALAGSRWIDPLLLSHEHPLMGSAEPIAFYCAHGHEISQFACALARMHGRDAVFVSGGFAAIRDAGLRLEAIR